MVLDDLKPELLSKERTLELVCMIEEKKCDAQKTFIMKGVPPQMAQPLMNLE